LTDAANGTVAVVDAANPPSFEILASVANSGQTKFRVTLFVLVYDAPLFIEIPVSPEGGLGNMAKVRDTRGAASQSASPA
jgi:hypothetical protein